VTQRHFLHYISHMDRSGIERGFSLNDTSVWGAWGVAWPAESKTSDWMCCGCGLCRRWSYLTVYVSGLRLMCRGEIDWRRGTAGSLASGHYQSRFVTTKSHIRISDLPTGFHDPTFRSICRGRLRRLMRRRALKQAATVSVHIL
jgi:hypothetical protein